MLRFGVEFRGRRSLDFNGIFLYIYKVVFKLKDLNLSILRAS